MNFELLFDDATLLFSTNDSTLKWKESNTSLFTTSSNFQFPKVFATSKETPAKKDKQLKKIKIQMGFACNFSCSYCSQSSQRDENKVVKKDLLSKADNFFQKMKDWFNYNPNETTEIEFWGGETLLYWDAVVYLAEKIKNEFPNTKLSLFTNGSLINESMAEIALKYEICFIFSHDGPSSEQYRGKDPLKNSAQLEIIKSLFHKLSPHHLFTFNAAINLQNFNLIEIQKYLADKLETTPESIILNVDLTTPYDNNGIQIIQDTSITTTTDDIFNMLLSLYPKHLALGNIQFIIGDFFEALENQRPLNTFAQKCSMDLPTSIAVDLDGNVLTCQNVVAQKGHKIGHVDDFSNIKLTTATHFEKREECIKCPVVHLCRGACMFLEDKLWSTACNQHFNWNLGILSFALYLLTDKKLKKITGPNIRNSGENQINVLL